MNPNKNNNPLKKDISLAYLFLRLLIGVNYFNHGFTRIGNIPAFVEKTANTLQGSYFPEPLVRINAFLVPIVELIVGILITFGLFTRAALVVTFGLMVILMMGVTSVQNWSAASSQLIYGIILFILLAGISFNTFSLDSRFRERRKSQISPESHPNNARNNILSIRNIQKRV